MEFNPGANWDELNECYLTDLDEETTFSQFKNASVFDEEEFENEGKNNNK